MDWTIKKKRVVISRCHVLLKHRPINQAIKSLDQEHIHRTEDKINNKYSFTIALTHRVNYIKSN